MQDSVTVRFELYCRAGRALNAFFGRWTAALCERCIEVTASVYPADLRSDVELRQGLFAGCCHAGVAENLGVPGRGEVGCFPAALAARMNSARRRLLGGGERGATAYLLRERATGRVVRGVGCRYLGSAGCVLQELKAPLCLTYVCDGIRSAIGSIAGPVPFFGDGDDFCGAADVLSTVIRSTPAEGREQVTALEARLENLSGRLTSAGVESGQQLLEVWLTR